MLNQLGILLDFKEKMMYWDDSEVHMGPYMPGEEETQTVSTADIQLGLLVWQSS